ncbi:CBS domain-containing protein [Luteimonas sp. J29]|uniref:CBS domain-containing protein n=1 Tax=Luteimonas sp. J29 TaxID=935863 RepID=UPI0018DDA026|nr:CBS domain-containing protein [Luteimonas sp. J29]
MSELFEEKLATISEQLNDGVTPSHETVRSLLLWFKAERRGPKVVREIRAALERYNLKTTPDFETVWLDEEILFEQSTSPDGADLVDPVVRIGRIEAANHPPTMVAPTDSLSRVVTVMLTNDFSQVPVATGPRDIKGVVSWKTIGSRLALGRECNVAQDAMEEPVISKADEPLFDAVLKVAANDYLLVQGNDRTITGIITASDFNLQFQSLAEPFLLSGEIEIGLRRLLHQKFTQVELRCALDTADSGREVNGVSDLTLGEYVRLLEAPTNWEKLNLKIDRVGFISQLNRVRAIRNDVMHFDPDGVDPDDLSALREFARFMKRLREVGCA